MIVNLSMKNSVKASQLLFPSLKYLKFSLLTFNVNLISNKSKEFLPIKLYFIPAEAWKTLHKLNKEKCFKYQDVNYNQTSFDQLPLNYNKSNDKNSLHSIFIWFTWGLHWEIPNQDISEQKTVLRLEKQLQEAMDIPSKSRNSQRQHKSKKSRRNQLLVKIFRHTVSKCNKA